MPICPKCRDKNPVLGAKCPRDGYYYVYENAIQDAETDPRIGTLAANKYVILGLISEGGMGAVYRALQLPVEREVALKVLRTELQDSNKGQERFIQEARAISRLSHPNIITLHDFGFEDTSHPYMVMEYAPGMELTAWLWKPDMSAQRLIHVVRQILSALAEAHKNNVVHRDIKPENIIITRAGNDEDFPKLLDFGIARLITEGATRGLTREGEVFGTPHYMSPEQAQGKRDIGPPSDVYAMGVLLHEFFTGEPPFDAEAPLSVLFMHINNEMPELIPRRGLELPQGVSRIVARATQKDPKNRYQHAGEMLMALDELLGIESTTTGSFSKPNHSANGARVASSGSTEQFNGPSPEASGHHSFSEIEDNPANVLETDEDLAPPAIDETAEFDEATESKVASSATQFITDEVPRSEKAPLSRPVLLVASLLFGILVILIIGAGFMLMGDGQSADSTTPSPTLAENPEQAQVPASGDDSKRLDEPFDEPQIAAGPDDGSADPDTESPEEPPVSEEEPEVEIVEVREQDVPAPKPTPPSTAPDRVVEAPSVDEDEQEEQEEVVEEPADEGPTKFQRPTPRNEDETPESDEPRRFERPAPRN